MSLSKPKSKKCIYCNGSCNRQFEDNDENFMFCMHWSCFNRPIWQRKGVAYHPGIKKYIYALQCRSTTAKSALSEIKKVIKEFCKVNIHKKAYKAILAENSSMEKYAVACYTTHFITYFLPYLRRYIDAIAKSVEEEMMKQVFTVALILNHSDRMRSLPRVKRTKSGKFRKVKSPILDTNFPEGVVNLIYSFAFPNLLPVVNSFPRDANHTNLLTSYSVLEKAVVLQLRHMSEKKELMERYYHATDRNQTLKRMKEDLFEDIKKQCKKLLFKRKGRVKLSL